jgi:NAD(P)-dependent dehydrogenase (short-subunit alcohol dehydrogenase family)
VGELLLVTGASQGLGRALLNEARNVGYDVVSVDRSAPSRDDHVYCDFGRGESVTSAAARLTAVTDGQPLHLVLNAGIYDSPGFDLPPDQIMQCLQVNCFGQLALAGSLARHDESRPVSVWAITSGMSSILHGYGGEHYVYAASKACLNLSVRLLEANFPNVRAVAVDPGWMQTRLGGDEAPFTAHSTADALVRMLGEGVEALTSRSQGMISVHDRSVVSW